MPGHRSNGTAGVDGKSQPSMVCDAKCQRRDKKPWSKQAANFVCVTALHMQLLQAGTAITEQALLPEGRR